MTDWHKFPVRKTVGSFAKNESSKRSVALAALDARHGPDVIDSLLEQIAVMAMKPASGTAAAALADMAVNTGSRYREFGSPGEPANPHMAANTGSRFRDFGENG